jgi:site-specific recombinase XerD
MKYVEERNAKTLKLLESAESTLPEFCAEFFLGISQRTQALTRLNYAYDLGVFFDFLVLKVATFDGKKKRDFVIDDLEKIEITDIERYADWLGATNKERGKMRKMSAVRTMFAYFYKKDKIKENILPKVDMPKLHQKNIVRLDKGEEIRTLESAENGVDLTAGELRFHGKNGFRDTVILKFFLSTGCRVSELVGLNVADVDLKNSLFRVTRKGGNETVLYLTQELHDLLETFIDPKAKPTEPVFCGPDGRTRLGVRAVQNLVKKYARGGAPLKNISPHKLRSTFGTNLYRATGDIYAVADVLGHQNVNTTKKHYAEITEDIRRKAIADFENKG